MAMAEFFEKTWLFWWLFCIVVILRWFYLVSSTEEVEDEIELLPTEISASPQPGTSDSRPSELLPQSASAASYKAGARRRAS
jgi:hypothetical protein